MAVNVVHCQQHLSSLDQMTRRTWVWLEGWNKRCRMWFSLVKASEDRRPIRPNHRYFSCYNKIHENGHTPETSTRIHGDAPSPTLISSNALRNHRRCVRPSVCIRCCLFCETLQPGVRLLYRNATDYDSPPVTGRGLLKKHINHIPLKEAEFVARNPNVWAAPTVLHHRHCCGLHLLSILVDNFE